MTALIRAAVYFQPGAGTFARYAQRAVTRGCWRYVTRTATRKPTIALEDIGPLDAHAVATPSVETELAARETVWAHAMPTGRRAPLTGAPERAVER